MIFFFVPCSYPTPPSNMGKSVDLDDVIRSVAAYFRGRSASVVSPLKGIRGAGTSTVRRVLTHSQDDGPRISGRRAVRRNIAVREKTARR